MLDSERQQKLVAGLNTKIYSLDSAVLSAKSISPNTLSAHSVAGQFQREAMEALDGRWARFQRTSNKTPIPDLPNAEHSAAGAV